jgi:organic radical activating enzyme
VKRYQVNEIYYTLHGEGVRAGIPHVFIRLAQCNLSCNFCDTEFESASGMTGPEVLEAASRAANDGFVYLNPKERVEGAREVEEQRVTTGSCANVLFCGGEPLLQLDDELVELFKGAGWHISVETNGTRKCPEGVDWITCSPKVAEHAIALDFAHEMKYVRAKGMAIPRPAVLADHYLISPMFEGMEVDPETMAWCVRLVKENPGWQLTMQSHKFAGVR